MMKKWLLIVSKDQSTTSVETQKNSPETKSRVLKSVMIATTLLATSVQAGQLLKTDPAVIAKCDVNWDWKISNRKTYKIDWVSKIIAKKEYKCSIGIELQNAQGELKNAQGEWKKLDKDINWLDKDIKKLEWQILAQKPKK